MDYKDDITKNENVSKDAQDKTDAPFDAFSDTAVSTDLPTFDTSFSDDPTQLKKSKTSVNPFEETSDDSADDFYAGLENDFLTDADTSPSDQLFGNDFTADHTTTPEADYPFMNADDVASPVLETPAIEDEGLSVDISIPDEIELESFDTTDSKDVQESDFSNGSKEADLGDVESSKIEGAADELMTLERVEKQEEIKTPVEEPISRMNDFKAAIKQTQEPKAEAARPEGMMFVPEGLEIELQKAIEPTFEPLEMPKDVGADLDLDTFETMDSLDEFDDLTGSSTYSARELPQDDSDHLSLILADDQDMEENESFDLESELPELVENSFDEESAEAKFFSHITSLRTDDLYKRVLHILADSDDMGIDATAKARINDALRKRDLAPLTCRELIAQRVITSIQFARAVARAQKRKEITNFLNIPHEAMGLRTSLDRRVCALLREARVIPLWHRKARDEDVMMGDTGGSELHLAHESSTRNLVLESALGEFLPDHKFVWHFAMRDVGGAFWLSSDNEDVDSSMEAEALLDRIVGNAIDSRSSDIHVDPSVKGEFKAIVKYRVDGFVQSKEVITLDQLERLRVRIENISRMPKVDLHHPNKGAFTRSGFDWRVQIQPHAGRQGPLPRIVIRRLQPDVLPMETLGYPEYFINDIKKSAASPNGVILWTGPTGSGKTESIHSAIVSSNPMGRGLSVHTIEDPPEKRVAGYAVQMEMSERDPARSGMELLKSSLRADPDVVVFGEVRDNEMAGLVFEAANTGHLVFTTLHTNTSLDAIVRLDELGIYGFNISYVRGIAAQRLVRRVCMHCRQPLSKADEYTEYLFEKYGVDLDGATLFKHDENGCPSCNYSGYSGRIAIAEWLVPNKELVEASAKRDYENLESIARRAGWKPMGYMGVLHVKNGITDVSELSAKVQELSGDI